MNTTKHRLNPFAFAPVVLLIVYLLAYGWVRYNRGLIRRLSRHGDYMMGSDFACEVFHPVWILERNTRSLYWRIVNRAPLFGHVYAGDCRGGSFTMAPLPFLTRNITVQGETKIAYRILFDCLFLFSIIMVLFCWISWALKWRECNKTETGANNKVEDIVANRAESSP